MKKAPDMAMNMSAVLQISAAVTGAQAIDELNRKVGALHGSSKHAEDGFSSFAENIKKFTELAIIEHIIEFGKELLNTGKQFQILSEKTGISVETLGKFVEAGKESGVSIEDVGTGFKKLSTNMLAAANGNREYVAIFKALGVSIKDANGNIRSSSDVMLDIANAFTKFDDGATKSAAAVKLFGKAGDSLIPVLDQGKTKINEFDTIITGKFAEDSKEFSKHIQGITDSFEKMAIKLIDSVLPALTTFLEKIEGIFKYVADGQFSSQGFLKGLVSGGGETSAALGGAPLQVTVTAHSLESNLESNPSVPLPPQRKAFESGVGGALAAAGGQDKLKEYLGTQQEAVDMLKAEAMQLDMTSGEYKAYLDQVKFDAEMKKLAIQNGGTLTEDFKRRAQAIEDEKKQLIILNEEYRKSFVGGLKSGLQEVRNMATDVGGAVKQSLTDAFKGAEDAFVNFVKTGKLDFRSLADSIIADLARIAFRSMMSSMFGGGGGLGSILSGFFGGGGSALGQGGIGHMALGGDNWRGGLTWVGENGPELINLPKGASVTPNHKLDQSGSSVTQHVTLNFAPGVSPQDLQQVIPHITEAASNLALRKINRGALKARA